MQGIRNGIRNRGFSTLRKKKPPLALFLLLGLLIAGVAGYFLYQYIAAEFNNPLQIGPTQIDVSTLWDEGNYPEIIAYADSELAVNPLNQSALTIGGFAHFHQGYNQVNLETKLTHIDTAISLLRRSLIQDDPYLRTEVYYILGKSYYHKGKYFADLSIKFLEMAKIEGVEANDLYEYLGLAYSTLGLYEESLASFIEASERKPTDTLFWTLAHTYYQLKQYENSRQYLQEAIGITEDWDLEQKCRFLLGEIFQIKEEFHLAEQEYNAILNKNSASADAHFYLGELYFVQGQKEKARAEWREAFKLDNYHFGANQRLFN